VMKGLLGQETVIFGAGPARPAPETLTVPGMAQKARGTRP
jgi:hypothetical protein